METIIRGAAVYLFLLAVLRLTGRRTLAQTTSFELVVLLIISETTQEAMIGDDNSITTAFLLILTLAGISVLMSFVKEKLPKVERWLDGLPLVIMEDGKPIADRLRRTRVDEEDIISSARRSHGLERLDQIKYAILEASGEISIVPKES
jgi:uncharacterized membrane protein YcaP (DUF421 family)